MLGRGLVAPPPLVPGPVNRVETLKVIGMVQPAIDKAVVALGVEMSIATPLEGAQAGNVTLHHSGFDAVQPQILKGVPRTSMVASTSNTLAPVILIHNDDAACGSVDVLSRNKYLPVMYRQLAAAFHHP